MKKLTEVNFTIQAKGTKYYIFVFWGYGFQTIVDGKPRYEPLKVSTGIIISDPKNFVLDESSGKRRISRKETDYISHNAELNKIETKILDYVNNYSFSNSVLPDPDLIKNYLSEGNQKTTAKTLTSLYLYIDDYKEKQNFAKWTKKSYKQFLTKLKLFETHIGKTVFIEEINKKTYDDFIHFVETLPTKNDTVRLVNGVYKFKSIFKSILNVAKIDDKDFNFKHYKDVIKVEKADADNVYIDKEKIKTLINLDLEKEEREDLQPCLDMLLIGLFTGLRISELIRLKFSHLEKDNKGGFYISIHQKKTKDKVRIPIDNMILKLIKKHDGVPIRVEQVFNRHVKDVCRIAGFTKDIEIQSQSVKGTIYETFKFYELVSAHTLRRSFCTNLFIEQIPIQTIMMYSGHKSEKSFLKYILVKREELDKNYYGKIKNGLKSLRS